MWKLKSESDTEKVYSWHSRGKETGRYRYAFADGRTLEVGPEGLDGESAEARHPVATRSNYAIGASILAAGAVLADVGWHLLR